MTSRDIEPFKMSPSSRFRQLWLDARSRIGNVQNTTLVCAWVFALLITPFNAFAESDRPVMQFPATGSWKQSFDSTRGKPGAVNRELRAALYVYSMLKEQGVSPKQIDVAIVVHGSATFDFLSPDSYRAHYGDFENPNGKLLDDFLGLGGEVWMSRFGLEYRQFTANDLLPGVGIAPAGLVAHAELNRRGFSLNPFGMSNDEAPPLFTPLEGKLPLSKSVKAGNVLYLSGDLGVSPDGKGLVPGGIVPETRRMLARIGEKLLEHKLSFKDIFKCNVFLADMDEWASFNAVYAEYFEPGSYPARSAFAVKELAANARVEMECMAWAG